MKKDLHWLSVGKLVTDDDAQAVVEYILMITLALALAAILTRGFRKIALALWGSFSRDISAACPGCPPDPKVRLR